MDLISINIDNNTYDYINSVKIGEKYYIAYGDGENIYICGLNITNNSTYVISDKEFEEAKKRMNLDGR